MAESDESYTYVFTERASELDDIYDDDELDEPDDCGVCGGPGPFRVCRLEPSAQPGGSWAIASTWYICSDCHGVLALGNPEALKSRLRPEERTARYVDVLVTGLLTGIR